LGIDGRVRDVVEARPVAAEEDDVMRIALALQEDSDELLVVGGRYSLRRKPRPE
jgi:hypothetical protein